MKRLYYLLLAACALFVLPQAARADLEVKLVGGYTGTWNNWTDAFISKGNNTYTLDFTSEKDGDYYFRVAVTGWSQIQPGANDADYLLTSVASYSIGTDCYGTDRAFKVSMTKGKTYTFTFTGSSNGSVARTVSCVEKSGGGSTDTDKEKVYLTGNYDGESWVTSDAFTAQGNNIYTYEYTSTKAGDYWFKFKVDGWTNDPCPNVNGYELTSESYSFVYSNDYPNCAFKVTMEAGKTYVFTFASVAKTVSCALKSGGGDTPTPPTPTVTKEYTEGYYLVGNFFNTDGTAINYDNGVFKFRQTSDDENGNARYMVEIPASLTAHAQVMAVGKNGKPTGVYGPGAYGSDAYGVSYTNPTTTATISGTPTFSETLAEGTNYWNMVTRNETSDNYTDGTYEITLTETVGTDGTKTITNWEIKHNALKRVAYFLSDAKAAVALPLYDSRTNESSAFSNKFFATINLSANSSYYVVSNYLIQDDCVDKASAYDAKKPTTYIGSPTANKLFLMGNGGNVFETTDEHNQFSPNSLPLTVAHVSGSMIVEYNPSKGDHDKGNTAEFLGMRGEVQVRGERASLSSVSMIGTAIPGTLNADNTWNYASTAGDMVWSDNEGCYKLTLVTTADDGETIFRFVGNHDKNINWHEDGTEPEKKAKTPYNSTDPDVKGHVASAADPNPVHYTQKNEHEADELHIVWNRPAGRYTVRFYTVTTTSGNDPVTTDYYTITENKDLELRDFGQVVYKTTDRKILNRGGYRYFRTWSGGKAWKRPANVDVFVVSGMSQNTEDNTVTYTLKNINNWNGSEEIIPARTGVILAMKGSDETNDTGYELQSRTSLTSYNTLVVPVEEASADNQEKEYDGTNLLKTSITAQTIPTYNSEKDEYNYLFGFYQANRGLGVESYAANEFLLGFWISGGSGAFYSNSAYLPVAKETAEKMNLGVSYNDFDTTTGAKKVPALLFDFESLGDGGNGEVTGIKNVEPAANEIMDNNYYTLGGQRISKPLSRGIYIHNGKKYIVK